MVRKMKNNVNEDGVLNPKMLSEAALLFSDTRQFIKYRVGNNKSLAFSVVTYLFFLTLHIYLIGATLNLAGKSFESKESFIIMNVIIVFALSLIIHLGLIISRIKSNYFSVTYAVFYLYGPALLVSALCIIVFFQALINNSYYYYFSFICLVFVDLVWLIRSWRSIVNMFESSKRQSVIAFFVSSILYIPVAYTFWAISGVLGRAV